MNFKDIITLQFLPKLGYWSSVPSNWIDKIVLEQSEGFFGSLVAGIQKRIIFTLLFPLFALIDTVGCLLKLLPLNIAEYFSTTDENKNYYKAEFDFAKESFTKNLIGFLVSPIGVIVYPEAVSFYHIYHDRKTDVVSSGGGLYEEHISIEYPETAEELSALVEKANRKGFKLIPKGAGLSQGKQFIPSKKGQMPVVVDLSKFKGIEIEEDTKTATVGAGVVWSELQSAANQHRLGVMVAQASNVFSIGGSIGTNIHGWDHVSGSLGNTIESMTVVKPTGEVVEVTPEDELFKLVTGGFGLFGIITQVKVKLTTNVELVEHAQEVAIDDYERFFNETVLQSQNTRMHYYRLSLDHNGLLQSGVAVSYVEPTRDAEPVVTPNYQHEKPRGTRLERVFLRWARRVPLIRDLYWWLEKRRLLGNARTHTTHNDVMHPAINAMFNDAVSESEWLQEYFVPRENLADFLRELGPILMENGVKLINASVRHVGQDTTSEMGYAKRGDKFAVVLCFNQSLRPDDIIKTRRWVQRSYDLVTRDNIGGCFYLPYQQFASAEQFDRAYPQATEVARKKAQYDPNGVLSNGLCEQYIAPLASEEGRQESIFRTILSNQAKRSRFIGFLQNILQRVDADDLYPLLDDILTYCDSHEDIYKELLRRRSEVMPSTLASISRMFSSLQDIRRDLVAQAVELMGADARQRDISGFMEIGYPGRFIKDFKQHFNITGTITAVHEQESLADIAQHGLFPAHDTFISLDYNKPDLSQVDTNSVEVMTCFVGLHHIPEVELDGFLKDIRRILKPGGSFLLVDHDVEGDNLEMAQAAHAFFNAVNGFSWEDENAEVRNFRSMTYWQQKLAEHGLAAEAGHGPDVEMIREGDPSRNKMVRFVAKPKTQADVVPMRTRERAIAQHVATRSAASATAVANPILRRFEGGSVLAARSATATLAAEVGENVRQGQSVGQALC